MTIQSQACALLDTAIETQRCRLKGYERPSELLTLETVRAIDYVYCRELFPEPENYGTLEMAERRIMSWGVNGALSRILPNELHVGPFKLFRSNSESQSKADGFLFECGMLALAERQVGLLREGLLSAKIDFRRIEDTDILVLTATNSSLYHESVGWAGMRWSSTQAVLADRKLEGRLEVRHSALLPMLDTQLTAAGGSDIDTSYEMDRYFHDWAELYLRRMPYRDMIDGEDSIGGRKFGDYVEVLKALSAIGQMRLCYTGLLKHRNKRLNFRDLITGACAFDELLVSVASFLDADTLEVQRLLSHLTLEPANKSIHLQRGDTAWAPVIRTSFGTCLLPAYGLDINPFLFLLNDLRWKYEKDWFRIANKRESRWIAELGLLFPAPRWQSTVCGVKLKRGSQLVTDIDFAVYDNANGEMALFQLKWQQPVAVDPKIRRSTGQNLLKEGNYWIAKVRSWAEEFGAPELARKLNFRTLQTPTFRLFVLARYGAHFSGYAEQDDAAVWAGWSHFQKARQENIQASLVELSQQVAAEIASVKAEIEPESMVLPLPGLAVLVNPISTPENIGY